jgi:hypothetical protein
MSVLYNNLHNEHEDELWDKKKGDFQESLRSLLNKTSQENGSNTPDFILARYLLGCLDNFNAAVSSREAWYGRSGFKEQIPLEPPKTLP